jgi:cellulose synthase (UDP-forming)
VQRQRWARGAIQILYLPSGPLGPGLKFVHRLLFLPTHWLTQSLMLVMSLIAPMFFLLFDLPPLANVTIEASLFYLFPMVLASIGGIAAFAPKEYFPMAAQVLGMFQCFKLLPTVLQTFVRPHGHIFKVTPKGTQAGAPAYERGIFFTALILLGGTIIGMVVNAFPEIRIVDQGALIPLVAIWGAINCTLLMLVAIMCLQAPIQRGEERFDVHEAILIRDGAGRMHGASVVDLSLSGMGAQLIAETDLPVGQRVAVHMRGVGELAGHVARLNGTAVGIAFDLPESMERDLLIRKIFTSGLDTTTVSTSTWAVVYGLLRRIFTLRLTLPMPKAVVTPPEPPEEKLSAARRVIPPTHDVTVLRTAAVAREAVVCETVAA